MRQIVQFRHQYGWTGVAVLMAILIVSLSVHEAAHAWVANRRGDPTGKEQGRISLSPVTHVHPVLTLLLPLLAIYYVGLPFGGARPVPVTFANLKSPFRDMALVAIAGPLSNIFLALLGGVVFHAGVNHFGWFEPKGLALQVVAAWIVLNILLAAFNLVPIPPLDGSRVVNYFLPPPVRPWFQRLDLPGIAVVLFLGLFYPPFVGWIEWGMDKLFDLNFAIVTLGGLW